MTTESPVARVTVLLVTYNHAPYIVQCLESIAMQRLSEPFDVVVADDASTDETLARIREFAALHPSIRFEYLDSSANRGITKNYQRAFAACRSEYVAVMEGDDYWTSPSKLRKQLEFLEEHRECDLCSTNYFVFNEEQEEFESRVPVGEGHGHLTARSLIRDNVVGNFSTCMYRRIAFDRLPPQLFEQRSYDWIVNITIARRSLIGFLREPMSVYRVHGNGTWSLMSKVEKLKAQLALLPAYDQVTDGLFSSEFESLTMDLQKSVRELENDGLEWVDDRRSPAAKLADMLPPILVAIVRLIVPPGFRRSLARFARRRKERRAAARKRAHSPGLHT